VRESKKKKYKSKGASRKSILRERMKKERKENLCFFKTVKQVS
jgi:hypothetical protein